MTLPMQRCIDSAPMASADVLLEQPLRVPAYLELLRSHTR